MSWLAASLVVLGLALVAGFAWYERSHPTSRVLALVATLAALAALGRIAFAPLPNVKPTTDIVLLTGYALGGAPGFAVGAVAALASNVFFGQGPWTPWQMCAWGGVGVGGRAARARVAGRELGRAGLAVACAARRRGLRRRDEPHLWVTYSGRPQPRQARRLLRDVAAVRPRPRRRQRRVLPASSAPRSCARSPATAQRFEVTWRPAPALAASCSGRAAARRRGAAPGRGRDRRAPGSRACRTRDGGFGGDDGQRSTGIYTSWAGLGLAAAGRNPRDVRRGGERHRRLRPRPPALAPLRPRRHHAARSCCCAPPACRRGSASATSSKELLARRRPNGSFANRVNTSSFAIFALRAAGRSRNDRVPSRAAARWVASQANRDGGFNFAVKGARLGHRRHRRRAAGARRRRPAQDTRPSAAPRASSPGARTPTAATRSSPAAAPTRSRPRGRSRRSSPRAATRTAAAATARSRRSPTCARSRPRAARSATRAPARRRPCGSPRRRSRRWLASRSRSRRCRARRRAAQPRATPAPAATARAEAAPTRRRRSGRLRAKPRRARAAVGPRRAARRPPISPPRCRTPRAPRAT